MERKKSDENEKGKGGERRWIRRLSSVREREMREAA